MKTLKIIGRIIAVVLVVLVAALLLKEKYGPFPELPPGYKLVCSVDGSRYSVKVPGIGVSTRVFITKAGAIRDAWSWVRFFEKKNEAYKFPSDRYKWKDCQEGK